MLKWKAFNATPDALKLYGYWRSSASWRVRWALQLREIPYEYIAVNILRGENQSAEHLARHPAGLLPVLELQPDGVTLVESMAILEWIEEVYQLKTPSLFPGRPMERAKIRSLCEIINSGTAPLQAPRIFKRHSDDVEKQKAWARSAIRDGLALYDHVSRPLRGQFSVYDDVTAADLCLIPQIYNALRQKIDVAQDFPELYGIYERAMKTPACVRAAPDAQTDAVPGAP